MASDAAACSRDGQVSQPEPKNWTRQPTWERQQHMAAAVRAWLAAAGMHQRGPCLVKSMPHPARPHITPLTSRVCVAHQQAKRPDKQRPQQQGDCQR